ncbi:hypothetical protein BIFGAL_04140 [Bifidobacterium gallicum DSM 20093 = LMG 11596]|uniref:Uncharacterized protein n=1 Tax=Bifidobacterium gallicum DSM 20093 = LMG 11596 TaxID=561180 RepID=D1NW93_9BIFI|nr:hypothetical protein BIFGAL_04140 [Bifidobacterium gallicum DSM 20093 = LMG 11596]
MHFRCPNRNPPDQPGQERRTLKTKTAIPLTSLVRKDALLTGKLQFP